MKRVLTTVLAVALLLGLGALAVLAMPSANAPLAAAPVVSAAAAAPEAVDTTLKWNTIALPLDVGALTADGVKAYIESFCSPACPGTVEKVAKWDPVGQAWVVRGTTALPANFNVYPGQALFVAIAGATFPNNSFAWTGDVPPACPEAGCIRYGVSTGLPPLNQSGWNFIMIPLDKSGVLMADDLKTDIGNVTKVGKWDATGQAWVVRGSTALPANYTVSIGYPYFVFGTGIPMTTWPNDWP